MSRPAGTSQEAWDAAGDIIVNHGNRTGTLVVSLQAPIARAIDAAILSAKAEQQQAERERINALIEEKAQAFTGSANPLASELVAALDDLRVCVARGERASAIRAGV